MGTFFRRLEPAPQPNEYDWFDNDPATPKEGGRIGPPELPLEPIPFADFSRPETLDEDVLVVMEAFKSKRWFS